MARSEPARLSPNVLLRPVVENSLFPVLAHVAGPGEIAYYAQLRPLFEGHDMGMPIVLPRHSATLLERKILKVLQKFDLDLETLRKPHHEIAGALAREEIPDGTRRVLERLRGDVRSGAAELGREVRSIDPTLAGPARQLESQTLHLLDEMEKKLVQSLKRENEVALAQVEKAQQHLFPMGKPQERILNPVYYLVRYGAPVVDRLLDAFRDAAPSPFTGAPGD